MHQLICTIHRLGSLADGCYDLSGECVNSAVGDLERRYLNEFPDGTYSASQFIEFTNSLLNMNSKGEFEEDISEDLNNIKRWLSNASPECRYWLECRLI